MRRTALAAQVGRAALVAVRPNFSGVCSLWTPRANMQERTLFNALLGTLCCCISPGQLAISQHARPSTSRMVRFTDRSCEPRKAVVVLLFGSPRGCEMDETGAELEPMDSVDPLFEKHSVSRVVSAVPCLHQRSTSKTHNQPPCST